MTHPNANAAVGQLVTDLLDYVTATTKLRPTTTPIEVKEGYGGSTAVMLHACWEDGRDIDLRVTVSPNGEVQELQQIRYFVSGFGMSRWVDLLDYETDDFIHHTMLGGR